MLDLLKHDIAEASELYADVWLGFFRVELTGLLDGADFMQIDVSVVDKTSEPPDFETIMALASKPVMSAAVPLWFSADSAVYSGHDHQRENGGDRTL